MTKFKNCISTKIKISNAEHQIDIIIICKKCYRVLVHYENLAAISSEHMGKLYHQSSCLGLFSYLFHAVYIYISGTVWHTSSSLRSYPTGLSTVSRQILLPPSPPSLPSPGLQTSKTTISSSAPSPRTPSSINQVPAPPHVTEPQATLALLFSLYIIQMNINTLIFVSIKMHIYFITSCILFLKIYMFSLFCCIASKTGIFFESDTVQTLFDRRA